jgi:hypothetical protein
MQLRIGPCKTSEKASQLPILKFFLSIKNLFFHEGEVLEILILELMIRHLRGALPARAVLL